MAHIEYGRNIIEAKRWALDDFMNDLGGESSFACLYGTPLEREYVAMRGIGRYRSMHSHGHCGVVVLEDDPLLVRLLIETYGREDESGWNPLVLANDPSDDIHYYEPLYGLSERYATEALLPEGTHGEEDVSDYLDIMLREYRCHPDKFGEYPYNLDTMLQLVSMPFEELDQYVLDYLPESDKEDLLSMPVSMLRRRLSAQGVQQASYIAVHDFALGVRNAWTPRDMSNLSDISITSAVNHDDIIVVHLPHGDKSLAEYLSCELSYLSASNRGFLLVASGVQLGMSRRLQDVFLGSHQSKAYSTGLLTGNLDEVLDVGDNARDAGALFRECSEIVCLPCPDVATASVVTASLGSYYRIYQTTSESKSWKHMQFFKDSESTTTSNEAETAVVRPEELVDLGKQKRRRRGSDESTCPALLWRSDLNAPTIVDDLY